MDRLWQDVRYGARLLIRFPGVTAAALIALALGTGVNTALFSVVNTVLLQPLPFPDAHELVQLWRTEPPSLQFGSASFPRYVDWRARNRVFEESGAWAPAGLTLTGREAPERVAAGRATASFFRTIGATPVIGRWFTEQEDGPGAPSVVVVSHGFWQRRLAASPAVLGSTLTLDGVAHTVIGVSPATMNEVWRVDAWVPLAMTADQASRTSNFLLVFGRLRDGMSLEQARQGLADLAAELGRDYQTDRYGFNALAVHDVITRGPRQALWILLGTTGFVLLIACANVANLLLARAVTRQKEMAVRTALGAGRARLLRQLITETVLLATLGGALGLLLAEGLLQLFVLLAPANFPRLASISLDRNVLLFSITVALVCGFVAGVVPAMHVARAEPSDALREGSTRGATAGQARTASRLLVMSEVALAVMLVAAAGLTVKSLQRLTRQDLGLMTNNVLTFGVAVPGVPQLPNKQEDARRVAQFFQTFEERLRGLPGATSVGATNMLPIAATGMNGQVYLRDRQLKADEAPIAEFRVVTPSYFETFGVRLVAGRFFDPRDTADTANVVIVNETLARILWPGQPPAAAIGQFMGTGFDDGKTLREVVAVVGDVRSRRVDAPPDAETYIPLAQYPISSMTFAVRSAVRAETLVPVVRDALADLNPQLPLAAVRTFEEVLTGATRTSRLYSALTALFGVLAALLAIVGIYSVMSYTVAQRTRELAIRAALGAPTQGLLSMVLREGFLMTGIGIAAGVGGAIAASRLLQALLYQVSPTDPIVLTATALGVAVAALLGYALPAMRASRVEPAVALRAE
jgi:putative ABC transport system permease protein